MRRPPLKVLVLALAVALLASAFSLRPLRREPLPPPEDLEEEAQTDVIRTAVLRWTAKRQVAREVIAGRLSLGQGAALFGALNRLPPEAGLPLIDPHTLHRRVPPRSDAERLCWLVIWYVEAEL